MVAVVEKWNAFAGAHGQRKDVWGFGDLLAVEPGEQGAMLIQCCAGSGYSEHAHKIADECGEAAATWLRAGNRIELHAWRRVKLKRGGLAMRWTPRVATVDDAFLVEWASGERA